MLDRVRRTRISSVAWLSTKSRRKLAPHQGGPIPIGSARHCPIPRARQLADIESQCECLDRAGDAIDLIAAR
jgi:hypothetical protein